MPRLILDPPVRTSRWELTRGAATVVELADETRWVEITSDGGDIVAGLGASVRPIRSGETLALWVDGARGLRLVAVAQAPSVGVDEYAAAPDRAPWP